MDGCACPHIQNCYRWKEVTGGRGHEHRAEETSCQGHLLKGCNRSLEESRGSTQKLGAASLSSPRGWAHVRHVIVGTTIRVKPGSVQNPQSRTSSETWLEFHALQLTLENLALSLMRPCWAGAGPGGADGMDGDRCQKTKLVKPVRPMVSKMQRDNEHVKRQHK